jgi:hypothetical protein
MSTSVPEAPRRDWWVFLGLAVTATSAAVSSFAGLRGLAIVAGWPVWLAPLFPVTIDSYAMTSVRVWLAASTQSGHARRFARTNAIGAIVLSLTGNATYHAIAVRLLEPSWVVVVAVGSVPALVLGLVSHAAVLRTQIDPSGPQFVLGTASGTEDDPQSSQPTDLLAAARAADAAYRAQYGRAITRDVLRQTLRIGGNRASELLRQLRDPHHGAAGRS